MKQRQIEREAKFENAGTCVSTVTREPVDLGWCNCKRVFLPYKGLDIDIVVVTTGPKKGAYVPEAVYRMYAQLHPNLLDAALRKLHGR